MSSFDSKWMDFSPETPKERSARSAKSPSGTSGTSLSEGFPEQNDAQGEPSWEKFYPELSPADFEITKTTGGVAGRKVRGAMVGTVGFFIPWGMLEKGPPPPKRKSSTRTEWNFSRLHVRSQTNPERVDPPKLKWWFVETVNPGRRS